MVNVQNFTVSAFFYWYKDKLRNKKNSEEISRMPRSDNTITYSEETYRALTDNGRFRAINTAENHGARDDEERTKWEELTRETQNKHWKNVEIHWVDHINTETNETERKTVFKILTSTSNTMVTIMADHLPTEEELQEENLECCEDGSIDFSDNIATCNGCGKRFLAQDMYHMEDSDNLYCHDCAHEYCGQCDRCEHWFEDRGEFEEVYDENDSYRGYFCPHCQEDLGAEWNEDNERYYINGDRKMQKFLNPNGVLAKGTNCEDCRDSDDGWCQFHLRQKIKEMEAEATTLWIYDDQRRSYHDSDHNRFKKLKYRLPNENPYLYCGIELEVLWSERNNRDTIVSEFIKATNGLFVAEYDRSVDELGCTMSMWGAEFISRPLSYKQWINPATIELLQKGLEVLKKADGPVNQPDGCGLHVHMSKIFFEKNTKKRVKDIKSDMDWFFQYFQPEMEKLSRRNYTQYCASKAFRIQRNMNQLENSAMFGVRGKLTMEKGELTVSRGQGMTHHDCVIETPKTIEARTFKSTLDINTILATIEACRGLAHAARNRTELTGRTFGDILFSKDSKYLIPYVEHIHLDTSRVLKNKMEVKL